MGQIIGASARGYGGLGLCQVRVLVAPPITRWKHLVDASGYHPGEGGLSPTSALHMGITGRE